mgnify:FL=1
MKEIIKKYWWIIIIVLLLVGMFYWFQWRPAQIRKECGVELVSSYYDEEIERGNARYKECIIKHGLEK